MKSCSFEALRQSIYATSTQISGIQDLLVAQVWHPVEASPDGSSIEIRESNLRELCIMCPILTFLMLQAGKDEKVNEGISNTAVLAVQVSLFSFMFGLCIGSGNSQAVVKDATYP